MIVIRAPGHHTAVGDRLLGGVWGKRMLGFVWSVLLLCAFESLAFSSGQGMWIKHSRLKLCKARSGALQGTSCVTSIRTVFVLHKHLGKY